MTRAAKGRVWKGAGPEGFPEWVWHYSVEVVPGRVWGSRRSWREAVAAVARQQHLASTGWRP